MPSDLPAKTVSALKRLYRRIRKSPFLTVALYLLVVLLLVFAGWMVFAFGKAEAPSPTAVQCDRNELLEEKAITVYSKTLKAEVAETPEDKYKGLSDRNCLGDGRAMLFPYGVSGNYCYVMRDMNFPIDMVWLDDDKKVVTIKHSAQPGSYPSESYCPERPARYVLEVRAGLAKLQGWLPGTQFEF